LTINPKPDVNLELFKKLVNVFITRTFVLNPVYTFEQTGDTDATMGRHPHCHIIFNLPEKSPLSPSQISDRAYSTFKSIVGNKKHCDAKKYSSDYRSDKIDYLKGNKWESEKLSSISFNNKWREKFGMYDNINYLKI